MKLRKLTPADVRFTITVEYEQTSVRGNALASGDDEADRECEDAIIKRLDQGDVWAWCTVFVTATWNEHEGRTDLGCCSYDDEADFKAGGYYDDMCSEALDQLNAELENAASELESLEES